MPPLPRRVSAADRPPRTSLSPSDSPSTRPLTSSRGRAIATRPRGALPVAHDSRRYGELVASDEVHDEIRTLGARVRDGIAAHMPTHGTSAAQVLAAVGQFGPSAASREMLSREDEAAQLARETGLYMVWRCLPERVGGTYRQPRGPTAGGRGGFTRGAPRMLSGATEDFCTRLGPRSLCFCGHAMSDHGVAATSRASRAGPSAVTWPCTAAGCACLRYRYVPHCPEEVGEGWLSRRAGWNPAAWSPPCRCGHGSRAHDPAGGLRCTACGCRGFESRFLCVVCDQPWEAHETVVETEAERLQQGRPVGPAYAPLQDVDAGLRALVLEPPPAGGALTDGGRGGAEAPSGRPGPRRLTSPRSAGALPALTERGAEAGPALPPHCTRCGTVYRSATSKFCSKCGAARWP